MDMQGLEVISYPFMLTTAGATYNSATGHISQAHIPIDVSNCDRVRFVITYGRNATLISTADAFGSTVAYWSTVNVIQSANANFATSTRVGTSALKVNVGSSAACLVNNGLQAAISFTTLNGDAGGQTLVLNGVTFTRTTGLATSTYTTAGAVGSTASNTAAEGHELLGAQLALAINSTNWSSLFTGGIGAVFRATTFSTAGVNITLIDPSQAPTGISLTATAGSIFMPQHRAHQSVIEFPTAMLDSTSRFVSLSFSTASWATSVQMNITAIKSGVRYVPSFVGRQMIAT